MALLFRMLGESLTRRRDGNVALIFALTSAALLMIGGIAIDLSRSIGSKTTLQSALDAASLAAARELEDATKTNAEIRAYAQRVFAENITTANSSLSCPLPTVDVDRTAGTVEVKVDCELPTTLASIASVDTVNIYEVSAAQAAVTRLDLALMLDVSGSMSGSKLTDLKAAAKDAADILMPQSSGDRVRMAFASYSTSVNAGPYAASVKPPIAGLVTPCVSEREGSFRIDDAAPSAGKWLGDRATTCPASSVLPLTSDRDVFKAEIDTLSAGGRTAGHLGVAWSWYLIAPEWDAIWPTESEPLAYGNPNDIKAVILMTDGKFNEAYAPGYGDSASQALAMCQEMRDAGVVIYAVAFQAPPGAKTTLRACSGNDPSRFFEPSNGDELRATYRAIASKLSALRLRG